MSAFYPTSAENSNAFFSPVPRAALNGTGKGKLSRTDTLFLAALLDYKNVSNNVVTPRQQTLADRFSCSLDTVQRALARLTAAGLIIKKYLRDARGRLYGLQYDLTPTLLLLPSKAAKSRRGAFGSGETLAAPTASQNPPETPKQAHLPKPQKCGLSEVNSDCQENKTSLPRQKDVPRPPLPAVVVSLQRLGFQTQTAQILVERFGADRVQAVVKQAARAKCRSVSGWIVAALEKGYQFVRGQGGGEAQGTSSPPAIYLPYHGVAWAAKQKEDINGTRIVGPEALAAAKARPERADFEKWRASKGKGRG